MLRVPKNENAVFIGDDAGLAAEISSLFQRPHRYFPVSDAPRVGRTDRSNEIIRRNNFVAKAKPRLALLAGLDAATIEEQTENWPLGYGRPITSIDEAISNLKGYVRSPDYSLTWSDLNLGVGLMIARKRRCRLSIDPNVSPSNMRFVREGMHLLVAVEDGCEMSQVIASNFAYSTGASFVVFDRLAEEVRDDWLESLYKIGSKEQDRDFEKVVALARTQLPAEVKSGEFKEILFITDGFPWGIAVPEYPTSHLYGKLDLGCAVINGLHDSVDHSRGARNALLVQPGQVDDTEIEVIGEVLEKNRTMVRLLDGKLASVHAVSSITQCVPFDIIVFSTHAGDWHGERVTYEFPDQEGRLRTLTVDEVVAFSLNPYDDMVLVQHHFRPHELDGVSWTDAAGKAALPVGTAITAWMEIELSERRALITASSRIERVKGAMALQMNDSVWLPAPHGLPGSASPIILNNACSSFHELSSRFIFAGARAYIGTLFPVSNSEAVEVAKSIFERNLGTNMSKAIWCAQNDVYGKQSRRPYVIFGIPQSTIPPNTTNPTSYLRNELHAIRSAYSAKAAYSEFDDVRANSTRLLRTADSELKRLRPSN